MVQINLLLYDSSCKEMGIKVELISYYIFVISLFNVSGIIKFRVNMDSIYPFPLELRGNSIKYKLIVQIFMSIVHIHPAGYIIDILGGYTYILYKAAWFEQL